MESRVYVDGRFVAASDARVSVFDHGLLYGDGIFEGIRAYNGRVFKLPQHVERLFASAKAIGLRIPGSRRETAGIVLDACRENRISDGYVRLLVTRGAGDFSLNPQSCRGPASMIAIAEPSVALYHEAARTGLKMVTSTHRRVPPDSVSPSIKSLNYLNNVLARMEATTHGADEALLLDAHGYVAEASADNFFIVRRGTIVAPPTSTNLQGITARRSSSSPAGSRCPSKSGHSRSSRCGLRTKHS